MNRGVITAGSAYVLWGLLPVYWKALKQVPALEILSHRVVWSLIFVLVLLILRQDWQWLRHVKARPAILWPLAATAVLLSLNWFTYIWATINNHVVEASLGYFITPLVSVLLGLLVLQERLRSGQWLAIAIASVGVIYLTINVGGLLWVAAVLAFSFGLYGLLRKTAALGSLEGLSVEMAILFLPTLGYLLALQSMGSGAFGQDGPGTALLLAGSGVITAVPLLLFASGARQVTLTTLGVLQYIAPTLQFLLGVFIYGEQFPPARLLGFSIIWIALLVYSVEGYLARKRQRAALFTS